MRWDPVDRRPFALRMAGVPFTLLAELADTPVADLARLIGAKREAQEDRVARTSEAAVLRAVRVAGDRRLLGAARTGTGTIRLDGIADPAVKSLFAEIAAGWAELAALTERLRVRYAEALTAGRSEVRERFVGDAVLRDVLSGLNPGSYPEIARWLDRVPADPAAWRAGDRVKFDPLTLYLQRACAKNDSTGRAGPFAIGLFDPAGRGVRADDAPQRHHVVMSRWAAEAFLRWLADDVDTTAVVPPRRAPGVELRDGEVDQLRSDYTEKHGDLDRAVGERVRHRDLSAVDLAVLELCDGTRTAAEIAAELERPGDAEASLHRLAARGVVLWTPEIPYGVADPLPVLEQLVENTGSVRAKALLHNFTTLVDGLGDCGVERRQAVLRQLGTAFTDTVGAPSARNHGGFYEDRALVYEESTGRFDPLVLGAPLTDRIRGALPLVADTYLFLPRLRLAMERDLVGEWFAGRFPSGSASVNDYLRAYADGQDALAPAYARLDQRMAQWYERLRDTAADAVGRADGLGRFRDFLAAHGERIPAVCDVDLMFEAGADLVRPARLVVTEVHSDEELLSHGMFAPFIERVRPDFTRDVLGGYRGLVADDEIVMDATLRHRNKTFAREPLGCPDIEASDRSPAPPRLRRHLADLVVQSGPRLVERATGRGVRLVALPLDWLRLPRNPMTVFGFPKRPTGSLFAVRPGEHLPEIGFGDVLLSRRMWSTDAAGLAAGDGPAAFLAVQRLRDRLGLPRHVFARVAGEAKPIYVDLDSPLLVRQLTRFAARAASVDFSEMVPGPDRLWAAWRGASYTSEIRFAVFDDAGGT